MKAFFRARFGVFLSFLLVAAGFAPSAQADSKPELSVAISLDIPPFVIDNASGGLEVDVLRQALEGYDLKFVQMSYEELQSAVQRQRAEVAAGVQPEKGSVYYSADFVTFANYAISRKLDSLRIEGVDDLARHPVLTWENAWMELGPEFAKQYAPQSSQRQYYREVADQREQVRLFWEGRGAVIVIDRSIFVFFSKELGHDQDEADFAAIFPPVTPFKVGFRDAGVRDRFDTGLAAMCSSGAYLALLKKYAMETAQVGCP